MSMMLNVQIFVLLSLYLIPHFTFAFRLNSYFTLTKLDKVGGLNKRDVRVLSINQDEVESSIDNTPTIPTSEGWLSRCFNSKYFFIVEGILLFLTLSAIDGGFSGDWSKYGFISKSTELMLQHIVIINGIVRIILAAVVYQMSQNSNSSFVFPILRVLSLGEIAFLKFYFNRFPKDNESPNR